MQDSNPPQRAGIIRKEAAGRAAAFMQETCETFVIIGKAADGGTIVATQGNAKEVQALKDRVLLTQ